MYFIWATSQEELTDNSGLKTQPGGTDCVRHLFCVQGRKFCKSRMNTDRELDTGNVRGTIFHVSVW